MNGEVKDSELINNLVEQSITSRLSASVLQEIHRSILPCMSVSYLVVLILIIITLHNYQTPLVFFHSL